MVTMEVQGDERLKSLVASKKSELSEDPLIHFLYKQRNLVVHKSMLKPASKGSVGFTRGRGMKLGLNIPIDPLSDSEEGIKRYIAHAAKNSDFLGILYTEEDGGGEYTCVQREWKLEQFPEDEITKLAATAWDKVAQAFFDVADEMGAKLIKPSFELGNPNDVQFEIYNPAWIKAQLERTRQQVIIG
ncbi:hypothetical protein VH441_06990 [Psychrobacter sp. HD31]|uniref:hypothetical protein n=1 Tax=Psychrobacter sp. HD31 TaxID=3112003 RepID=UPI003DA2D1F9